MASSDPLSEAERRALAEHEGVIDRALGAFVDLEDALFAIHSERLYRRDYESIAAYCQDRWKLGARADGLITMAGIAATNDRQTQRVSPRFDERHATMDAWWEATWRQ